MAIFVSFDRPNSSCTYYAPPSDNYALSIRLSILTTHGSLPPADLFVDVDCPAVAGQHTHFNDGHTIGPASGVWTYTTSGYPGDIYNGGTVKVYDKAPELGGALYCQDTITPIHDEFGARLVWQGGDLMTPPVKDEK